MSRQSGRTVNIASMAGKAMLACGTPPTPSKGAVISLTRTASQQLVRHDINVNALSPGVTRTELSGANLRAGARRPGQREHRGDRKAPRQRDPPGAPCEKSDIAAMAVIPPRHGAQHHRRSYNVDGRIIQEYTGSADR